MASAIRATQREVVRNLILRTVIKESRSGKD